MRRSSYIERLSMNTFFHSVLVGEQPHKVWETASAYWLSFNVTLALSAVWIFLLGSEPQWLRWGYLLLMVSALLSIKVVMSAPKTQTLRRDGLHIITYLFVALFWFLLYFI